MGPATVVWLMTAASETSASLESAGSRVTLDTFAESVPATPSSVSTLHFEFCGGNASTMNTWPSPTFKAPVPPFGTKAALDPVVTPNRRRRPDTATDWPLFNCDPPTISRPAPSTGFSNPDERASTISNSQGPTNGGSAVGSSSLFTYAVVLRVCATTYAAVWSGVGGLLSRNSKIASASKKRSIASTMACGSPEAMAISRSWSACRAAKNQNNRTRLRMISPSDSVNCVLFELRVYSIGAASVAAVIRNRTMPPGETNVTHCGSPSLTGARFEYV